jgi:2-isopropylmalate synthase
MAVANSLAAIQAGAGQVECTINGIGERAGNAALEEIAIALHIRDDIYKQTTNLRLNEITKTSELVSRLTGMVVQKNKAVVGANAFAHESGIHQDGVLKEPTTYEIIPPELIGLSKNSLILGKHSGRHAFNERLIELGCHFSQDILNRAFVDFKSLTDTKKVITEEDLYQIIHKWSAKEVTK